MRTLRGFLKPLLLCLMLALVSPSPALAQAQTPIPAVQEPGPQTEKPAFDQRRLLVPRKNADGSVAITPFLDNPAAWARDTQRFWSQTMNRAMNDIQRHGTSATLWLMLMSFAYGVLHAAGPGHGKAVISGWMLATESQLRRGMIVSALSAIVQALSAISLVTLGFVILGQTSGAVRSAAGYVEQASFLAIALMGLWLVWTSLKPARKRAPAATSPVTTHRTEGFDFGSVTPLHSQATHVHDEDCGCGHAHVPAASEVSGDWSARKAVSMAFAVGIRPCSGAILVLIFSYSIGLYWAGILSVFAMAIGTAITVMTIAALTVYGRSVVLRLAGGRMERMDKISRGLRIMGGVLISLLGLFLFWVSLGGTGSGGSGA